MISPELEDGILAYRARIKALGGYGIRIRVTMPDGVIREGILGELGAGGCQPGLRDDNGKRWAVRSLDNVEVLSGTSGQ